MLHSTARPSPRLSAILALVALLLVPGVAEAKVSSKGFAKTVTVGGEKLVLNGVGMREATVFKVDVYRGGLYLKGKSSDGKTILGQDQAWHLHLKFVRDVEAEKMVDAWKDGFKSNVGGKGKAGLAKVNAMMVDIEDGQTMTFSYDPAAGTTVKVNGKKKGMIKGAEFGNAMLSVFIGKKPPNKGLKRGLLGR